VARPPPLELARFQCLLEIHPFAVASHHRHPDTPLPCPTPLPRAIPSRVDTLLPPSRVLLLAKTAPGVSRTSYCRIVDCNLAKRFAAAQKSPARARVDLSTRVTRARTRASANAGAFRNSLPSQPAPPLSTAKIPLCRRGRRTPSSPSPPSPPPPLCYCAPSPTTPCVVRRTCTCLYFLSRASTIDAPQLCPAFFFWGLRLASLRPRVAIVVWAGRRGGYSCDIKLQQIEDLDRWECESMCVIDMSNKYWNAQIVMRISYVKQLALIFVLSVYMNFLYYI